MKTTVTVRPAVLADAEAIFSLIGRNRDELVPRSMGNLVESIDRFVIAEAEGRKIGCAAYQIHPEIGEPCKATVEFVSVAVEREMRRRGVGRAMITALLERVRSFAPREIIVLTFAPAFFASLGFVEIPKTKVMHKLYTGCINCTKHANPFTCPEIAMTRQLAEGKDAPCCM